MRNAGKVLLMIGAVFAFIQIAVVMALGALFGVITIGGGGEITVMSMIYNNGGDSYNQMMQGYGLLMLTAGGIIVIASLSTIILLSVTVMMVFVNVMALDDVIPGYAISIFFGVLTLFGANLIAGFFIMLGGILGLVGAIKERKKLKALRGK